MDRTELLFSYGTLQLQHVQRDRFGRDLAGTPDRLAGWRLDRVEITDPAVLATSGERWHPVARRTGAEGDAIAGTLFPLTPAELAAADSYEVDDYRRIAVTLMSGAVAWVYVATA